ncbi:MAG: AMP-binding protein, partial [Hyphomonadaceae bacterium]
MQGSEISFAQRLRDIAAEAPDAPAILMGEQTLTRAELHRRSNRMARGLLGLGFKPGDLLTIGLPNSIGFLEVCFACWKIGANPQPVSSRLPQAELDAIAELAESPFVVGQRGLASRYPVKTPEDLLALSDDESDLPDAVSPSWKAPTSGGSTGRPKLILSGQPSIFTPEFGIMWHLTTPHISVMPGPLYHNGPFQTAVMTILQGGTLALLAKFDAEETLREVAARKGTWLYLVPTMMSRISRLPEETRRKYDVSSLKTIWHLAAPCPQWLKREWIDWLGPNVVWELYGATEGQAATVISGHEWLKKPGSVGRVFIGEIVVLDPDGKELPRGETGELYMRWPPGTPATYVYRGAESKQLEGGWESVGDIGYIDADG